MNSHGISPTSPSSWRVCQFRHPSVNSPISPVFHKDRERGHPVESAFVPHWRAIVYQMPGRSSSLMCEIVSQPRGVIIV